MTPFIQGRAAYLAGSPITANPCPAEPPRDGDEYPGPYHEWRKGWLTWESMDKHRRKKDG